VSGVLVYSERKSVTLELLTFGATLPPPTAVALLGADAAAWTDDCFAHGADRAYAGDGPALADLPPDVVAEALSQIVEQAGADVVLIGSTLRGREVAGRLAQKLGAGCTTDANGLRVEDGRIVATRYALGGNTIATQVIRSARQVVAVMPQTVEAAPTGTGGGEVVPAALALSPSPLQTVERRPKEAGSVDVESAEVLLCVGRGLDSQEDLGMIQALADVLGGVVGCTRPVSHDNHWLPESQMVGISGKTSSPRLYVGVGVSGQIQHAVGIMGSRITVAINKDRSAPVFQVADYGIVGDLYEVVPKLTERLKSR
jgi:electron transfer flavoprotein alpha subunit